MQVVNRRGEVIKDGLESPIIVRGLRWHLHPSLTLGPDKSMMYYREKVAGNFEFATEKQLAARRVVKRINPYR